ncbi:ATP-binding cassette domain-containing protein [Acidisoma sp. C75]
MSIAQPSVKGREIHAGGQPNIRLQLSNVSKSFAGITALADVSATFFAGEVHAVLGENGAGKSTLMNIIAGALRPSQGTIAFEGQTVGPMSPELAASLGIAICYQHPNLLEDLSVLENLQVALPRTLFAGRPAEEIARGILANVGLEIPLSERGEKLTIAQKQLIELAKALAVRPKLLILDEPTASLDQESTELLFRRVHEAVALGTSIIYITHRMAEVRQIAHRVTVLRDGRVRGGGMVDAVSDADLLALIVGRTLGSAFPAKSARLAGPPCLSVRGLHGQRFRDVNFAATAGEIVGVAGVSGNGQSELMRALAGLTPFDGEVNLHGRKVARPELQRRAAFMPADRHAEGVAGSLSVRENAAAGALGKMGLFGVMSRRRELRMIDEMFDVLAVKAPGLEAPILALSGGNQQKVVMARALLSGPDLIIADEPTQGVDVGARAEIYRILRQAADDGAAVIVNSSDAAELEGLCDKVIVLSRGRVVETLTGDEITETRIVGAAVGALTHFHEAEQAAWQTAGRSRWRQALEGDSATVIPLAVVTVLLALLGFSYNPHYLSAFNISNVLQLATTLGFIAFGQTVAMLLGGIDLSVGPLSGFLVVVASFFINTGHPAGMFAAGFVLIILGAGAVGLINGGLIRFANFTPIAATLAMYIGLQGASFLLRGGPGGYIDAGVVGALSLQIGPLPVAFLVMCLVAGASEYLLRCSRLGWRLRAVGSDEHAARRIGLRTDRIFILGYIASALFTALGAIMLMAQIGVGDPQQGISYTLGSITAVVLGGTSLRGGRGSFIGTALGALLLTEVLNVVSFLGMSQTWQYVFQGLLVLSSALIYATLRGRGGAGKKLA